MPATFPDAELNAMATAESGRVLYISLHTADPGTTGVNEATGGTPAYARKAPTFNAGGAAGPLGASAQPATPGVAWSGQVSFDVPAGTYTHFGVWDALTAGGFRGGNALSSAQVTAGQGVIKVSLSVGPFAGA